MLWMEEKGLMVVDEPSLEPGNILRNLKWHEKAERELLATRGHVEGLQQVGPARRLGACLSSHSLPSCIGCLHRARSLKEEPTSVTAQLGLSRSLLHSAGHLLGCGPKPAQRAASVPSPNSLEQPRGSLLHPEEASPATGWVSARLALPVGTGAKLRHLRPRLRGLTRCSGPCSLWKAACGQSPTSAPWVQGLWLIMVPAAQQDSLGSVSTQVGRKLLSSEPCAQEDVQAKLRGLSSKWEELNRKMAVRGEQLRQAWQQDRLRGLLQVG